MYLKVMLPRDTFRIIENISRPVLPIKNRFFTYDHINSKPEDLSPIMPSNNDKLAQDEIDDVLAEYCSDQYGFSSEGANLVYYSSTIDVNDLYKKFNFHAVSYWDRDGAYHVLVSKYNIYLCNDNGQTMEAANIAQPKGN